MLKGKRMIKLGALVAGALLLVGFFVVMSAGTTTIDFSEGDLREAVVVQPARWPRVETAHARVFREPALSKETAREVLEELGRVHALLVQHFPALPLGAIEVVLLPEEGYGGKALSVPGRVSWPLVLDERGLSSHEARYFLVHLIPHEWAEEPISRRFYWRDRSMRWFGDGVAEYAGFVVSRALDPHVTCTTLEEYVGRLEGLGGQAYDLPSDFRIWNREQLLSATPEAFEHMMRGYAVSFAVFFELASRYGPEAVNALIGRSLGWLWPPPARVKGDVQALLGEGAPPLTAVPYAWALERIKAAKGEVCEAAAAYAPQPDTRR